MATSNLENMYLSGTLTVDGILTQTGNTVFTGSGTVRTPNANTLILLAGTSATEGPYISIYGKDVGGSNDGLIEFVGSTESSAVGGFKWYNYNGSGYTEIAAMTSAGALQIDGDLTATGINVGEDTLSLYDENTWTPTVSSAATAPTIGYSSQNGIYTRTNNKIEFQARIVTTTISGGTAGNSYRLSLPVAGFATTDQVVPLLYRLGTGAAHIVAMGVVPASSAYINVYAPSTLAARTNADLTTNMLFMYSGTYFV